MVAEAAVGSSARPCFSPTSIGAGSSSPILVSRFLAKAQKIEHHDRFVAGEFLECIELLALWINMVGHGGLLLWDNQISIANPTQPPADSESGP